MPKLVIVKGLPLSGKTEWSMQWVGAAQKRVRVSWSDILQSMGHGPSRVLRPLAVDAACRLMSQAFREGCDVVLDECNLYPPEFAPFLTRVALLNAKVEWHNMGVSLDTVKERNAQLGHPVREMELERMAEHYAMMLK